MVRNSINSINLGIRSKRGSERILRYKSAAGGQRPSRRPLRNDPPPEPYDSHAGCLNLTAGLYKKAYEGYFDGHDEFFDSNSEPVLTYEYAQTYIDDFYDEQNNTSIIIKGYFKPIVNGVYKFRLSSDIDTYLWLGENALDGNRIALANELGGSPNSTLSLPGIHELSYSASVNFTMTANSYYPLTVEFGVAPSQDEGTIVLLCMPPGSSEWTSNLTGYLFYDVDSKGHRVCPPSACVDDWTLVNFGGTTFRNGDPIPQIEDATDWANATGPAWCYYDNDPANGPKYGKLYNRAAVTDVRELAPEGYYVPSLAEWQTLIDCLGGISVAGEKMKTTRTTSDNNGLWTSPNIASNESQFSVVPGGVRAGGFVLLNDRGGFWVSDSDTCVNFNYNTASIYIGPDSAANGYSIRLIQGTPPSPPPPAAYLGKVLSLDEVPYDVNPNQITFTNAGVSTVNGVYVYTQTGFYGPVVNGYNNFVAFNYGSEFQAEFPTGFLVGDWSVSGITYFNTGNISFVNRVEITNADFNLNDTYTREFSDDIRFDGISQNGRCIELNENGQGELIDDDGIVRYINDDINLDPNGWYYNYTNTINLSGFYGYEDGTAYTNEITISGAGTFDDTYRRQFNDVAPSESATVDGGEYYIPFANTTFISQVVISNAELSDMNGTYTRGETDAGYEGQFRNSNDVNFTIYWDSYLQRWVISGPGFYCDAIEDNMDYYAYNPSLDMSANWVTDNGENGCNKTPPSGSITVSTISDINYKNGLRKIENKGALSKDYGTSMDPFFGWYLYDPMLPDAEFPRYGIHTDDTAPTTLPAYTSVKSFRVSGLTNAADDGVYSRYAGLNASFTKAGSNPIYYEDYTVNDEPGWTTWIPDLDGNEVTTFKLPNSAEITTGGWERKFVDKIVFSGANNIANGTYIWQNQYVHEEENLNPVLTVLGSGGNNENRGWRISATDDNQTNYLDLQSSPQITWWNGNEQPSWYLWDDFGSPPQGLQTVMTSSDRGLTWTSPYPYQFNLGGLPAPHTAYNKTYTFTSAGSLILECEGEGYAEVNRIYYGDNMCYQANGNIWRLQFPYTYQDPNNGDTIYNVITLQKTGPSPIGTWTSVSNSACTDRDTLIIGGTIVGSNAIAFAPGSGTLPTLSISEIEYVSGDANYSNPTLTSQISGNIISVDGTYTRNIGGSTSLSNGTYTISTNYGNEWFLAVPQESEAFRNDSDNLNENNWHANGNGYVKGTASNTTARYNPQSKADGLLGIQYSGYFGNDPTWFNAASVKPIINQIMLYGSTESEFNGTYTKVDYGTEQGISYYQGDNGNNIYHYSQYPINESYWYLSSDSNSKFISYDLETWFVNPEAHAGGTPPLTTILQTQNFENSTNFGVNRALSNDTSWQWVGYFKPNDTSNHDFYLNADEDAYFWIGDKALNGYTTGNADIYSTETNGSSIVDLPLTSETYYPVRMQWGHPGNPTNAGLSLSYSNGIQNATNNFSGLFFNFIESGGIATNSNGIEAYDFRSGEWQSTNTGYNPAPQAAYSHVWLDSISGFVNAGIVYSGNKHVTLVNDPTYSSDYSGVYSFNGVDQYAMTQEVPQSTDGSISHFTWFKPTGAGVVVDELGQPGLFGGWHDTQLEVMQDGKVNFGIWGDYRTNSTLKIQSTGSINFDRWYHLGLTYSSGVLSSYIDGEKIADSNCPSRSAPSSLYYAICGGDSTNMGEGGFGKGSVGSFQVYNKGLTQTEVGNLYSGEKDRFPTIDDMFSPSLWLDASTGVNRFDYNYVSQIVITGAINPDFNGTYVAAAPGADAEGNPNSYVFGEQRPAEKSIEWSPEEGKYYLYPNDGQAGQFESDDGINWTAYEPYIGQITVSGFTGIYAGANGTYNGDGSYFSRVGGGFFIEGDNLKDSNSESTIATAPVNYSGSWTPTNYNSSVTLTGAGKTSVNGIYTRSDSLNDLNSFSASGGRSIRFDGNEWLTNGDSYIGGFNWEVGDLGNGGLAPAPTNSFGTSARNVGSPTTSSVTLIPNGSVTGTITTSNVISDHVTSWTDQSNNNRNATLNNGQPLLTTIEGNAFIEFPNNGTDMALPAIWEDIQVVGTILVVAYFTSSADNSVMLTHSTDTWVDFVRGVDGTNAFFLRHGQINYFVSSLSAENNSKNILEATFDSSTASLYLNGVSCGSGLGASTTGSSQFFIGGGEFNIAEIIIYNRVLNTSERQQVESYLSNKYDISLA